MRIVSSQRLSFLQISLSLDDFTKRGLEFTLGTAASLLNSGAAAELHL